MSKEEKKVIITNELQMLTCEEVGSIMGTNRQRVQALKKLGVLHGIVTGNKIMFSQDEIKRFMSDYEGLNVSNDVQAIESMKMVDKRKEVI